ncbi:MAG: peptidoglycan-binding domain-containing protein [Patescibacteria group bacterium]|jgi:hypothetical protein
MKKVIFILSLLFLPLLASASFDANLYYGLQNNNSVKEMQEFLTDQGVYSGPITGNFYSLTLKSVKDFQSKENITPVSGFFGPLTRQRANTLLSANVEPSNQQAIQETGSTPPPAEPAKTTNDVVKSLQNQIALLLQQVQAMQTQQTSVQQLQQTVQQQAETINQIQQNTQQIAQNTTPIVCTPNWSCGDWGACINSQQERTCTDSNNCESSTGEPVLSQSCTAPVPTCTLTFGQANNPYGQGPFSAIMWTSENAQSGKLYSTGISGVSCGLVENGICYKFAWDISTYDGISGNLISGSITSVVPGNWIAVFTGHGRSAKCHASNLPQ